MKTVLACSLLATSALAVEPCRIAVVDDETGWPVPLVELTTTHRVSFFTDNAGVVAFDLPECMGRETWLGVSADGYEAAKDGFGFRGVRFTPEAGGVFEIRVSRTMPAKRLGRITGAGIFGESRKLGEHLDWEESGAFGRDSVQNVVHGGRMFWAWGDTKVARYPLGLFHMTAATSAVRPLERFEPPLRLRLDHFRDERLRIRNVADVAPGDPGPTWLNGFASLPDESGARRLVATYAKIEPPLATWRTGLCAWNEDTENFESVRVIWEKGGDAETPPPLPGGHPVSWRDEEGRDWVLFGDPFPTLRIPASYEAWLDPGRWKKVEAPGALESVEGGPVRVHRGSIAWNGFRSRWVVIFCEQGGDPSALGEIWYAEADSPLGPWGPAVKVLSHRRHTFYNPRIHPEFTPDDSPVLLFEGTYTETFSRGAAPTPRHDYNQVLYRLDLDDPGLEAARNP